MTTIFATIAIFVEMSKTMAGKLSKPLGLRLQDSTIQYFEKLALDDHRILVDYLRLVLEFVEKKNLTWKDLSALPDKPSS
jgi:hypothetical protein